MDPNKAKLWESSGKTRRNSPLWDELVASSPGKSVAMGIEGISGEFASQRVNEESD